VRLLAFVAISISFAVAALAAAPEDGYWAARERALAQLKALADAKADPLEIRKIERAALAVLQRNVIDIVGPVDVEGFAKRPKSHLAALTESPDYGSSTA
jgi:hypothetical protein